MMTAVAAADWTHEESGPHRVPRPQIQAGDLVDGYQLIRPIGRGGTGTVWAGRRLVDGRRVAIKVLSGHVLDRYPELADRLIREWEACSRIEHDRVVTVYGYGTHLGLPYLVMDQVEGETLFDRVRRDGPLSLEETAAIVAQVAEALGAAHDAGVIHRDVKAGNIMLGDDGVMMLDFGFAKLDDASRRPLITQEGTSLGSPTYMSPEQYLGSSRVDHRTDVWALAVVAYFALTGASPFSGLTFVTIAAEVLDHRFTAPCFIKPDLPDATDTFFQRAFARSIDDRHQSAGELAHDLTRLASRPPLRRGPSALAVTGDGPDAQRRRKQIDTAVQAALRPLQPRPSAFRWGAIAFACTLSALVVGALVAQLVG